MSLVDRVTTSLVINEFDPISNGGRNFAEFIELKNVGATTINLKNYYINMTTLLADPAPASYFIVTLIDYNLAPGGWFVICATPANVPNCKVQLQSKICMAPHNLTSLDITACSWM